ncbi:cache domain-containing protein [Methyloversatilis discipulorum]|uniref:cache domain-containing protein n=1 Tax=Methyloversatilis discipulorum TaxID=1119528 RepID=UPI001A3F6BE1|nr:cache domain-containing protein [Methyloversatilis discipulorum]MBL8469041.1 cache domain-containing protein [Methyloversatilis discipulorum]
MRFIHSLRRGSVRTRLVMLVLAPPLLMLPLLIGLVVHWGNSAYDQLLIYKVNAELTIARQYFDRVLDGQKQAIAGLAASGRLRSVLDSPARLGTLLEAQAAAQHFDYLYVLDREGRVRAASNAARPGEMRADWPVVRGALAGDAKVVLSVFDAARLDAIGRPLLERARLAIVPTTNARPDPRSEEDRGMVIHIAVPILDAQGEQIGVLEGGQLLNRNLDFVDTINDLVYNDGALPLGSRGTATLFLDDVRIATNVRMFGGDRALGTRVSAAVRHRVLDNGERWLDRAFVVNDWYVSGYEPVVDGDDRRIGMLYVGFLEAPFREVKQNILAALIGLFALIMAAGVVLSLRGARSIFRPIERMDATIGAVEKGDASARTGTVEGGEEIARLASHLDTLLDTVAAREAELKQLNAELDQKVVERTAELREAQRQLVRSEKLAAIGQLTAGVAHEINNPIAVMQGNLDLMRALLGPAGNTVKTEIRLLDEQINRIRVIVTKLLQYARPGEFAGYVDELDTAALLHDTLPLVQHQARKSGVDIVFDTAATTRVRINRDELQQVLVNLVVNALHAMPDGGTLTLSTRDSVDPPGARIDVRDTGHGIAPEHIGRVFDPFFTTKRSEGTGLGLSVSLGLIERYGGTITVSSTPGEGTCFSVHLLAEPQFRGAEGPAHA